MTKEITIFTLNVYNNNYLSLPPSDFCMNSWYRLVNSIKELGYQAKIKIYTNEDNDYIDYCNICYEWVSKNKDKPSLLADGFRIYILSKYKNYLWVDSDIYFCKSFKFADRQIFSDHWAFIYNSDDITIFKKIFKEFYSNNKLLIENKNLCNFYDKHVYKYFNLSNKRDEMLENTLHLSFINNFGDPETKVKLCKNINSDFSEFDFDRILVCLNNDIWIKFSEKVGIDKARKYARSLKNDSEVIDYLLTTFPNIKEIK